MTDEIRGILTNKEVIAVDQDALGYQGRRVKRDGGREIWSKQMADGSRTVALLNRGDSETEIRVAWTDIGYPDSVSAAVRDLWAHQDLGSHQGGFAAKVPSHGVVMITVRPGAK
jgi:alpha-galactosidase